MSNIFNIKRFGKYLAFDLNNCISQYGVTFIFLVAFPIIHDLFHGIFTTLILGSWGGSPFITRAICFVFVGLSLVISQPIGCYGKITEKRIGTKFLSIPVSSLEKSLSMILISGIIAPAVFVGGYLCIDYLVCAIDPTNGDALFTLKNTILQAEEFIQAQEELGVSLAPVVNPAMYIDDIIQSSLIFLLGSIFFKKAKVAKTLLTLVAFGVVSSMITSPIILNGTRDLIESGNVETVLPRVKWCLENVVILDFLSDTIVNLLLCAGIYLRVRTLKH